VIIGPGEVAQGQGIGLGLFAEIVDARDAAAARHVLHDDGRTAGNKAGQVPRDDTSFDVRRTAGAEIDEEGDGLSLIKRTLRREPTGTSIEINGNRPYHPVHVPSPWSATA
jgi:hypothetical protein